MTIAFVYKWTQISTGMWYIGSRTAKGSHPYDGYICSSKFVKPLIKANPNDWERTILYIDEPQKVREKETFILQELNAKQDPLSYNRHNNDNKFFPLYEYTDEIKRKISDAHKGKPSWNKGKSMSEETKQKLSEAKKGKTPWNKGKTGVQIPWNKGKVVSEKTRLKISESKKGRSNGPLSQEHCRKISDARKGITFSEEHRRKLSNRVFTDEWRKKISEAHKGKKRPPRSEEHCQKISEALKNKNRKNINTI